VGAIRDDPARVSDPADRVSKPEDSRLLSASMAIRDLLHWGDERLIASNEEVIEPDGLSALVADLVETCHAAPGVGLAAPQIGVNRRVAVVDLSVGEDPSAVLVLVNPVVILAVGEQKEEEGCLSVPDVSEKVVRPARVVVRAADADLNVREIEGTGLLARALCHETDHLNGMLFVDRLRGLKKEMTFKKIERRRTRGDW
jgi:peptide deformylase